MSILRRAVVGMTALTLAAQAPGALADGHGWDRMPPYTFAAFLIRRGYRIEAMAAEGDVLITLLSHEAYVDPDRTDFLGNPRQIDAELVRCVEERDTTGIYRTLYCERF